MSAPRPDTPRRRRPRLRTAALMCALMAGLGAGLAACDTVVVHGRGGSSSEPEIGVGIRF